MVEGAQYVLHLMRIRKRSSSTRND